MTIHHQDASVTLHHGDCLAVLRTLPDASVDSVVCDPPYGLEFMGKEWDKFDDKAPRVRGTGKPPPFARHAVALTPDRGKRFGEWCELWAVECLRVLKPGGHLLAFGGTRTWHRLACAVEDAGFEVRDSIAWLYGSGFPKSLDVSKAIDKAAGAEREVVGSGTSGATAGMQLLGPSGIKGGEFDVTAPATDAAREWAGWGTALKPSFEGVVCAVKPVPVLARIGSRLDELEQSCRPLADGAESSSAPTPADSPEAKTATAPASAATQPEGEPARLTPTGAAAGSSVPTATSASESTAATFSNTVTSWRACWVELCEATSTSTTGTTSSTTTDLETLWSCLSQITPESITTDPTSPDGPSSLVGAVDAMFAAAVLNSRATRTLTAIESATSETHTTSPAAEGSRPAFEPVVVARKPLAGGTVAANVLAHGTGALNIDASRIGLDGEQPPTGSGVSMRATSTVTPYRTGDGPNVTPPSGRWPANVILDEDMAAALDQSTGHLHSAGFAQDGGDDRNGSTSMFGIGNATASQVRMGDKGGASRFFYVAKAGKKERPVVDGVAHPTVKPLALMRWLVRLVTPPGGTVLEPFAGSGTTVEACLLEGFRCVAIEKGDEYLPLIVARIDRQALPEAAELTRTTDQEAAIVEQIEGQLDIFGEGVA